MTGDQRSALISPSRAATERDVRAACPRTATAQARSSAAQMLVQDTCLSPWVHAVRGAEEQRTAAARCRNRDNVACRGRGIRGGKRARAARRRAFGARERDRRATRSRLFVWERSHAWTEPSVLAMIERLPSGPQQLEQRHFWRRGWIRTSSCWRASQNEAGRAVPKRVKPAQNWRTRSLDTPFRRDYAGKCL